jgi:hypothetical protein
MAVSVTDRPKGFILGDCVAASIDEDYSGFATVNHNSHGLIDGQYVYVSSDVEDYNGFWSVDVIDGHHFFLLQYPSGPKVPFVVNADISYCPEVDSHGWQCVHLPIVYKLSSNLWPVNSVDTVRTVSSFTDDNGYTNLNLSGALKGTVNDLHYIKISGASSSEVNGVWQIKDAVSTSDVTINLAYDSGYSFSGASVQFYYKNYHVKVKVFGGIDPLHINGSFKPYEQLAELKFIPDSEGKIMFSISNILKSQINTRNNLQLATLPNNIDFWTQFYISVAESYDESDGSDITAYTSSYTSDQSNFQGYAVNAKLPFKNLYSGHLTPYVMKMNTAKFLTLFTLPVLFACSDDSPECYQDISFIVPEGVIDEGVELITNESFNDGLTDWSNEGTGQDWTTAAGAAAITLTPSQTSKELTQVFDVPYPAGEYTIETSSIINNWSTVFGQQETNVTIDLYNGVTHVQQIQSFVLNQGSPLIETDVVNVINSFDRVKIVFESDNTDPSYTAHLQSVSLILNSADWIYSLRTRYYANGVLQSSDTVLLENKGIGVYRHQVTHPGCAYDEVRVALMFGSNVVSEEKTFEVNCECSNQELRMSWLNYLGGFDYWNFTAQKSHQINVLEVTETKQNIFPSWPRSYGEFADTIEKEVSRTSKNQMVVRSQYLTLDQLEAIKHIRTSPLVQIVNSRRDRRTVKVDSDSFQVYDEGDKLYSITFTISFTDLIPSQSV